MALSPEDLQKIRDHFASLPLSPCPVCGTNGWEATGPWENREFSQGGGIHLGGPVMPVIALMCRRCFHLRYFAWLPILNAPPRRMPVTTGAGGLVPLPPLIKPGGGGNG